VKLRFIDAGAEGAGLREPSTWAWTSGAGLRVQRRSAAQPPFFTAGRRPASPWAISRASSRSGSRILPPSGVDAIRRLTAAGAVFTTRRSPTPRAAARNALASDGILESTADLRGPRPRPSQYNPRTFGGRRYGYYPPLDYPDYYGYGYGFGPGIYIGGFFGGLGWGGWAGAELVQPARFLRTTTFSTTMASMAFMAAGWRPGIWGHNPVHRMGVAYPNRGLASRYGMRVEITGGRASIAAGERGRYGAQRGPRAGDRWRRRAIARHGNWQHFRRSDGDEPSSARPLRQARAFG